MDDEHIRTYISASAALLGIPMDAARTARVAAHLQRTAAMAEQLEAAALAPHEELAEIYSPAAFQPNNDGREQL